MSEKKDPAVLFYISDWLSSTAEMDADCRGWYLNLILHNYDKGSLPDDVENLAMLAGVKFSEYSRFEHVFEQVLKQKFEQTDSGRLSNRRADDILRSREDFKEKRSDAGKMSYVMRYFANNHGKEYRIKKLREFVKQNFDLSVDLKNKQVLKHMFEHLFELYRNGDRNRNEDEDSNKIVIPAMSDKMKNAVHEFLEHRKLKGAEIKSQTQFEKWLKKLSKLSNGKESKAIEILDNSIANGWQGIFALEEHQNGQTKPNDTRKTWAEMRNDIFGQPEIIEPPKQLNQ